MSDSVTIKGTPDFIERTLCALEHIIDEDTEVIIKDGDTYRKLIDGDFEEIPVGIIGVPGNDPEMLRKALLEAADDGRIVVIGHSPMPVQTQELQDSEPFLIEKMETPFVEKHNHKRKPSKY